MLYFQTYDETQPINMDFEVFEDDRETSIDIISAFMSREGIKRLHINIDSPFISPENCDICGASNLINHYILDAILFDGDLCQFEICNHCKQAIMGG